MADQDPILTLPEDPVRLYLAEQDAPCPGCGYNLRGIQDTACPECGRKIELTLSRPGRSRGYLLFVLLALGWVLTAGTMNGLRAWQRVRAEATPPSPRIVTFSSFQMSTGRNGMTQTFSSSGRSVVTLNGNGGLTVTTTPTVTKPPGTAWGNVSNQTWMNFGWWSSLGLLASTTLILVLILRRRFAKDAPPWKLVVAAAALFALYAGYHALAFSREFIL